MDLFQFLNEAGMPDIVKRGDTVKLDQEWYLIGSVLQETIKRTGRKPVYAGQRLGKDGKVFQPGLDLLQRIAKAQNTITVTPKAEWLFICGRAVLQPSITALKGSTSKGSLVFVLNRHAECLGIGRIEKDLDKEGVVENVFNIGDFLRRERKGKFRKGRLGD
ncbi:hypothetical protein HY642_01430 [Candidatus Woesearchaeota archaeon]|nr:hypothetical protein [Candidatus Woesearchaeota archaeon]